MIDQIQVKDPKRPVHSGCTNNRHETIKDRLMERCGIYRYWLWWADTFEDRNEHGPNK